MRSYDEDLKLLKAWYSMCDYVVEKAVNHPWVITAKYLPVIAFERNEVRVENTIHDAPIRDVTDLASKFLSCIWDDALAEAGSDLRAREEPVVSRDLTWRKQLDKMIELGEEMVEKVARTR